MLSIWSGPKFCRVGMGKDIGGRLFEYPPHSSVGSVAYLRTGGHWFDPRLGQYSFRELMIAIATGFIPLSPLSAVSTMVMWDSNQWLGKNIELSSGCCCSQTPVTI